MCLQRGVPARPARGPCNESHWTYSQTTTSATTTLAANLHWDNTATTGGGTISYVR